MTAAYPILPSEIKWSIYNTPFNRSQTETMALNLVKLSAYGMGDNWSDFTEKDIIDFAGSGYTANDRAELQTIVNHGYIHLQDGVYKFTPEFAQLFIDYKSR